MNFDEINREIRSLRNYIEVLKNQYKDAIHYLTNIYNIVNRHDVALSNDIKNLIDRYYDMLRIIDNEYAFTIDDIVRYVKLSNRNINNLMINIAKVAKDLDDSITNVE